MFFEHGMGDVQQFAHGGHQRLHFQFTLGTPAQTVLLKV
jgi:hypothetical protein